MHQLYALNPVAASRIGKCISMVLSGNTKIVFIGFVCYDDACHLTKFAKNPSRADLTPQAKQLDSVQMVVDKIRMKGRVDR